MKVLFTVQGEGRGHLTQALSIKEMLDRRGHQVVGVVVGSNGSRPLPEYFARAFDPPIAEMISPGFTFSGARGVSAWDSLAGILRHLPAYARGLRRLRRLIRHTDADLVINFLEPLMGLHNLLCGSRVPTIVVGHQYMLEHPGFLRTAQFRAAQAAMRGYLALVGARSARLALSFYAAPDVPHRRLTVCPPLLRQQLFELEEATGDHVLVYLLNHGYADAILRWHSLHPHIPIHCFYDKPGAPAEARVRPQFTFHRLHGEKFLRLMAGARAVVCTAGFESVGEAAYLGKPLLMIPVENHVEQYVNACDAVHAGLGLQDSDFRLSRVLAPGVKGAPPGFRRWVDRAESIAMHAVETAAGLRPGFTVAEPAGSMTREPAA